MRFNFKRFILHVPKLVLSSVHKLLSSRSRFQYSRVPTGTEKYQSGSGGSHQFIFTSVNNMACCSTQLQNVIHVSISFMLVFTSFQTMGNIEETILRSIHTDDPSFTGNGYISLSILYAVFALCNWVAPSIVAIFKEKWSIFLGALTYTAFIASFLFPKTWLLYLVSAVLGLGAAVIWAAQGSYLALCSTEQTMPLHASIFWAILQSAMFFGNTFVFFMFQDGGAKIEESTRFFVFSVLTAVSVFGLITLLFLRNPQRPAADRPAPAIINIPQPETGPYAALKRSFELFMKKEMILLAFTFFYTGIELSFYSGVYSTSVGSTVKFGEYAKRLVGLSGILVGAGEVIGGAVFGLLGGRTVKHGRDPIVLLGFLCHTVSFYLIFINLPNQSPLGMTSDVSYMKNPSAVMAMACSFLLGFGDACYNTQIYSMLGGLFAEDSVPVFALFKFTQSLAAALSFFYSSQLTLRVQLGILQVFCFVGTLTFFLVEWDSVKKKRMEQESVTNNEDPDDEYRLDRN